MIRPLRSAHRFGLSFLFLALPPIFISSLMLRKEVPATNPTLPGTLLSSKHTLIYEKKNLWRKNQISARAYRLTGGLLLELEAHRNLKIPELLVYWNATPPQDIKKVPNSAYLLGTLNQSGLRRYKLPAGAGNQDGVLLLYNPLKGVHSRYRRLPLASSVKKNTGGKDQ